MTMKIEYANGRNREVESLAQAMDILDSEYPDAVYGDWEENYDGDRASMRVWENEEIAGPLGSGDDGSSAVAWIMAAVEEVD